MARCFGLIKIGTTTEDIMGKPKELTKLMIQWELPHETTVFDEEKGEQPFVVSEEYTATLSEKANLRHMLEGWRGRAFTDADFEGTGKRKGFLLDDIVGVPCMINIIHKTSRSSGKPYAVVSSVSGMSKGSVCPPQINPKTLWDIDEPGMLFKEGISLNDERTRAVWSAFENLHKWIKDKIRSTKEWREYIQLGIIPHSITGTQQEAVSSKPVLRISGPAWDAVIKAIRSRSVTIDELRDKYDMDASVDEAVVREMNRVRGEEPPIDPVFEVAGDVEIEDDLPF